MLSVGRVTEGQEVDLVFNELLFLLKVTDLSLTFTIRTIYFVRRIFSK